MASERSLFGIPETISIVADFYGVNLQCVVLLVIFFLSVLVSFDSTTMFGKPTTAHKYTQRKRHAHKLKGNNAISCFFNFSDESAEDNIFLTTIFWHLSLFFEVGVFVEVCRGFSFMASWSHNARTRGCLKQPVGNMVVKKVVVINLQLLLFWKAKNGAKRRILRWYFYFEE